MTEALRRPLPKPMLAVSCLVLCAACVADEPSDPEATGSAAVVDLFSPWPGDESLQIAAEPSLVVGSDESLPLGRVSGAVFFGDGIAIADIQSYEVLILDAAGRLLSRQGRQGEGPGDYMNLAGIARHADGLITWDAYHHRVTRLDASGRYVGETKLRTRGSGKDQRWLEPSETACCTTSRQLGIPGGRGRRANGDPAAGGL